MMNIARLILKLWKWKVDITVPPMDKCIICVAPHTSNWDFILGKLAYASVGRDAGFLMKSTWFFPPLGWIFKAMGGIPVVRTKSRSRGGDAVPSLVEQLVEKFNSTPRLNIAITPEGTRSRNANWHTGFLRISLAANVPVALGVLDYRLKTITISDIFIPTGDMVADMHAIKLFYKGATGKYPEKFTTESQ